jgi:hypothetical protein
MFPAKRFVSRFTSSNLWDSLFTEHAPGNRKKQASAADSSHPRR